MREIPQENRGSAHEHASEQEATPDHSALSASTSHDVADEEPSVDVAELAGPPGLPGPLYDAVPTDEHGRPSWERLHHALEAVESLLRAGMVGHARSVVSEAKAIVEAARGPRAQVIQLGAERSRHRVR